uniref:Uncharacterized protein n=1 Tax=Panagrolaimus sp. JU765 TaxID=591449 RepID=A0AC34RDP0_9BILA
MLMIQILIRIAKFDDPDILEAIATEDAIGLLIKSSNTYFAGFLEYDDDHKLNMQNISQIHNSNVTFWDNSLVAAQFDYEIVQASLINYGELKFEWMKIIRNITNISSVKIRNDEIMAVHSGGISAYSILKLRKAMKLKEKEIEQTEWLKAIIIFIAMGLIAASIWLCYYIFIVQRKPKQRTQTPLEPESLQMLQLPENLDNNKVQEQKDKNKTPATAQTC